MKEIIASVFIIIGALWGGKVALKKVHDTVRTLALEKAAKGLPPLAPFARALAKPPQKKKAKAAHGKAPSKKHSHKGPLKQANRE